MYARTVRKVPLTFCVSGMLWNRSLVMMDTETKTLWSHILGEAMEGKLKGEQLEKIPCDMVTWGAWKKLHPATTVLNMSRTNRDYTREFYRDPSRFVIGWVEDGQAYSVSFKTLQEQPVLNGTSVSTPVVVAFDPGSTSALLYGRKVDGRTLTFEPDGDGLMKDRETGSVWLRGTGQAVRGRLKGKRLEAGAGIISYARAWSTFHPDSRTLAGSR